MFNSRIILGHSVDKCRYFDVDYLIIPKGFFVILNASFLGCRVTQRRFWELPWPTKDSLANNFLFRKMIAYFGNRGYGPMFRRFINMDSTLCTTFEFLRIHRSQKMRSSMGFFQNALCLVIRVTVNVGVPPVDFPPQGLPISPHGEPQYVLESFDSIVNQKKLTCSIVFMGLWGR